MPAGLSKPTLEALAEELAGLRELVLSRVWYHRKEVLQLLGISKDTLYRRMKRGDLPRPSKAAGPIWSKAEIDAAIEAGRRPRPKSDAARTRPPSAVRA